MKLTVSRSVLWRAIDTIIDVVPTKPAMPILSSMLMSAAGRYFTLSTTDLDISIRTSLSADIHEPGTVTIPVKPLAEILRDLPESELTLEHKNDILHVDGSLGVNEDLYASYTLPAGSPDHFPSIPADLGGIKLNLSNTNEFHPNILADMIYKTVFAVARDDTRPVLNGVLFNVTSKGMSFVATDTYRFAHYNYSMDLLQDIGEEGRSAIIPPASMNQIAKLLQAKNDISLKLTLGDTQLLVDIGDTQLLTRLIEGPYVNYKQVIPLNENINIAANADQLHSAVRRVSVMASSYTHQVQISMKENLLELSANSPEIGGQAREMITATYDGQEMEVNYNAKYLMEILRHMQGSNVVFSLESQFSAALLRPSPQHEGHDYFCLLMPLRTKG